MYFFNCHYLFEVIPETELKGIEPFIFVPESLIVKVLRTFVPVIQSAGTCIVFNVRIWLMINREELPDRFFTALPMMSQHAMFTPAQAHASAKLRLTISGILNFGPRQ